MFPYLLGAGRAVRGSFMQVGARPGAVVYPALPVDVGTSEPHMCPGSSHHGAVTPSPAGVKAPPAADRAAFRAIWAAIGTDAATRRHLGRRPCAVRFRRWEAIY